MNKRIRQIRKKQNMSQTAFGAALGISRDVISNYETGRVVPTDLFIKHLCSTFYVNESWLRFGIGEAYIKSKETILDELIIAYSLNNRESTLIKAFLQLSPEDRAGILEYANTVIKLNESTNAPLSKTQYSFRAARSKDNTEPEIIDSDDKRAKSLLTSPTLSSDNEL